MHWSALLPKSPRFPGGTLSTIFLAPAETAPSKSSPNTMHYPRCKSLTRRTGSTTYAMSPRCSCFPSLSGCRQGIWWSVGVCFCWAITILIIIVYVFARDMYAANCFHQIICFLQLCCPILANHPLSLSPWSFSADQSMSCCFPRFRGKINHVYKAGIGNTHAIQHSRRCLSFT